MKSTATILAILMLAATAQASRVVRIFDNGNGTVRVERDDSFNSVRKLAPGELARFDLDKDALPSYPDPDVVPRRYWAWDGANVVAAPRAVRDAVDAAIAAEAEAAENAQAPDTGYETLSREMRWTIRMFIKLATLHGIDEATAKTIMRQEWDATR